MSFRTAEPALRDLLDSIAKGETQLPDFQRGWVWDDNHIRSLIASLSLQYPIGAVMLLETGSVPFKPRLFEGCVLSPAPTPKNLVLDGQQRLTSMYLALRSGMSVTTRTEKGEEIKRVYFLDMAKCLDPNGDREEAVVSVPETLRITSNFGRDVNLDLSTADLQIANKMFPVAAMFDPVRLNDWKMRYLALFTGDAPALTFLFEFEAKILMVFNQYKVPAIELGRDTPREAVCQVFEKVNTGGVTLTVFELMTATFAASDFNLRDDWDLRSRRMTTGAYSNSILNGVDGTAFLTAVTLYASYERSQVGKGVVSCKRSDVLRLELGDYQRLADKLENGFKKAVQLLAEEKIFDERVLPYANQLIPLAAICAALDSKVDQLATKQKVMQWFWCGVFGELYGSALETRYSLDLPNVVDWVNGGGDPRSVRDSSFAPNRLLSLQSRNAAAYKGLSALLMRNGSRDFITGTPVDLISYFNTNIDIHHIFPRNWCETRKLPRAQWNSIVNKAPLTYSTNRTLGGYAPSLYLHRIERDRKVARADLDAILASHLIPVAALRSDDFHLFLRERAAGLLDLIEQATGKAIAGRDSEETEKAFGGPLQSVP